jgi:hypothetical protein
MTLGDHVSAMTDDVHQPALRVGDEEPAYPHGTTRCTLMGAPHIVA